MATVSKRSWNGPNGDRKSAWRVTWMDHAGKRHRQQFSTKAAADDLRVEVENQLRHGVFRSDARKMTVEQAADAWLDYCRGRQVRGERMTRMMLLGYEGLVENYILAGSPGRRQPKANHSRTPFSDGIGQVKLMHVTPRTINALVERVRAAGLSISMTRKVVRALHTFFKWAAGQDLIAANPAAPVRVIGRRDEGEKKIAVPAKETVKALIQIAPYPMMVRLVFAATTGVRAGEQHALRYRHLDLQYGSAKIETRVDAFHEEDGQGAKTAAGNRTIPLGAAVVELLKKWKANAAAAADDDLVFPGPSGSYEVHTHMV